MDWRKSGTRTYDTLFTVGRDSIPCDVDVGVKDSHVSRIGVRQWGSVEVFDEREI